MSGGLYLSEPAVSFLYLVPVCQVATLIAYLFTTLGPAGLLRKLRGFFTLVVYDPQKVCRSLFQNAVRSPGYRVSRAFRAV